MGKAHRPVEDPRLTLIMQPAINITVSLRIALVIDMLTEEDGEEDEGCYVKDLQILELLVQPADDRRRQEDGEESDGQPARIVEVSH